MSTNASARTLKLTVLLVNGDFEIHKAGCRDIARTKKAGRVGNEFPLEVGNEAGDVEPSEYAVIADLWADQISEAIGEGPNFHYRNEAQAVAGMASSTKFHGCVSFLTPLGQGGAKPAPAKATPKRQPKPKPAPAKSKPKTSPAKAEGSANRETPKASAKQAAKRELATLVAEAAARVVFEHVDTADIPQSEAAKYVAHWLHHLPADRDRWVAAGLPKPDRSDWR